MKRKDIRPAGKQTKKLPKISSKKDFSDTSILFDIDNVLIETEDSYLDSIRWTVEIFLTHGTIPFFTPDIKGNVPQLLSKSDVDEFKLLGGFNDDWDCCYGILVYLLNLPIQKRTLSNLKASMNIKKFSAQIKKRPLRVSGIVSKLGYPRAVTIEKISRIFQEVYLGKKIFQHVERRQPVFWNKLGLIDKEKLIVRKSLLKKLTEMGIRLGIATGRPRFEAVYALKRFGILEHFDAITTSDEVKKAEKVLKQSLRKPHPFSLLESAKIIGKEKKFFYIGDLPDDILAARKAKPFISIRSIGFPWYSANPKRTLEEIQRQKPDFILKDANELVSLIKQA